MDGIGAIPPYKGARGIIYITTTISLRLCTFARVKKKKSAAADRQARALGIDFPNFSSFTYDHF
jgi:hypothetical protein